MASVTPSLRRRFQSDRGSELIEFALMFPVLMVVLAGMFDFGLAINQYTILTNAAREGARVAAMPTWSKEDVLARVESYAQDSGLALDGLNADVEYDVNVDTGTHTVGAVRVSVSYNHDYMLLDTLINAFMGEEYLTTLTMRADSTMRTEVVPTGL
jgi:Flp pilus assembly protein TadG